MPDEVSILGGVSCPATHACLAVGALIGGGAAAITGLGTRSWRRGTVGGNDGALLVFYAVTCPSTARCIAASPAGPFVTNDGGGTWYPARLPTSIASNEPSITAVSCASPRVCIAIGDVGMLRSADAGATWTLLSIREPAERAVSCARTTCVAVGGTTWTSTDGGTSWARSNTPPGFDGLTGVACASASTCVAVGNANGSAAAIRTSDAGRSWSAADITPNAAFDAISCPSTLICLAVGTNSAATRGLVARTTDGGASWSLQKPPPAATDLYAVSCPTSDHCVTVGKAAGPAPIFFTSDGGASWQ